VNVVRATFEALRHMKSPQQVAEKRGLTMEQMQA
jgi:ribosomal protein S5